MRRLCISLVIMACSSPAQAQFFRRHRVQVVQCQQTPVYAQPVYQQYYQPNYIAVAAVPLATVPVAIDLQAYAYSVNAQAFQSFRDYQSAKVTQEPATPVVSAAPVERGVGELAGAAVLKQRCASCHTSGKIPRFFDAQGNLLAGAPLQEMLERITSDDPAQRMPPKGQLPTREAMAILNYAASGLPSAGERTASTGPSKPTNPFE